MGSPSVEPDDEDLSYWSFVDVAMDRTVRALPGVDAAAMRLVLSLHRAATSLAYDLESAVHRPRGWSWPGFRVLFVLFLTGPIEAKRVAQLSGMSRAAVSALVNTLVRDGLVSRRPAEHDRRAVLLALTDEGERQFTDAFAAHNRREQSWAAALDPAELATLTALLEKLMASPAALAANRRF
ncbi:MarR family winged helix-turn-helix transcriptional regulator [Pseudonocardia nigra]|uniref:MarR family winged helix-turn-helix transcriptional regulator n=1 Tax=Pseudonocardia nigra TaxID=1921578 RepID=UPI001C5EC3CA|nr:MarR family transcriptional regulator [Pseudonocardia nigra]